MLSKNNEAIEAAENGCLTGMKWLYLVNLSTTTKITEYPLDNGSPSIKSIEMSDHEC
jgi:hypothetical protein